MQITKQMFASKKFRAMLTGLIAAAAVAISTRFGLEAEVVSDLLMAIAGIVGSYVLGQGIADHGKEAAIVIGKADIVKSAWLTGSVTKDAAEKAAAEVGK